MKNLKLLSVILVALCFFATTNMNAQKWGNSGKFEEIHIFPCPCSGELLQGTLVFQMKENGKMNLLTIKGRLVGVETGSSYNFHRVDVINNETGQASLRVRTVRRGDGLVTNFTIYYQDGEIKSECF